MQKYVSTCIERGKAVWNVSLNLDFSKIMMIQAKRRHRAHSHWTFPVSLVSEVKGYKVNSYLAGWLDSVDETEEEDDYPRHRAIPTEPYPSRWCQRFEAVRLILPIRWCQTPYHAYLARWVDSRDETQEDDDSSQEKTQSQFPLNRACLVGVRS